MKKLSFIHVYILLLMSIWTSSAFAIPSITTISSVGTRIKFTATLSEKLLNGYKVKVDYLNGKDLLAMTCSNITCTLSSTIIPTNINTFQYKIGIYNAKGILQDNEITDFNNTIITYKDITLTKIKFTANLSQKLSNGFKVKINYGNSKGSVDMTCTDNICTLYSNALPIGIKSENYKIGIYNSKDILQGENILGNYFISTSRYSKISSNGKMVIDTTLLGRTDNKWTCTKDNETNLIWAINTINIKSNSLEDIVSTANKQNLCGKNDWRLSTDDEIYFLAYSNCTNESCRIDESTSTNKFYFPNAYWQSSQTGKNLEKIAWSSIIYLINSRNILNYFAYYLRLVSG